MSQRQFLLTLSVAIISGSLGGALSVWFLMPPSVLAQDEAPKVIEAQEFRVVDEEGKRYVRVAQEGLFIYDQDDNERVSLDREQLSIRNPDGAAVLSSSSPMTNEPTLALLGKGSNNMLIKPTSLYIISKAMSSKEGLNTVLLDGANLSLRFSDPDTRAVLGTTQLKHPDTGSTEIRAPSSLVLFDEDGDVVWKAP